MGIFKTIREEINIIRDRDPAMHSNWEVLLYPTFWAMLSYRRAHKQYLKGHYFRARWISQRSAKKTRIEIHPGAQIGKGFFIDHGTGVVIGETTIIGDNCTLYQGVTLGGTGKEQGKRHPTLGNNVMVGAGAKILGSFKVGDNCRIAAGSVVLQEVPANCTVVGIPGRVVKMFSPDSSLGSDDLDQIHFPDPVRTDIECLNRGQTALTDQLLTVEDENRQLRADMKKVAGERDSVMSLLKKTAADRDELRAEIKSVEEKLDHAEGEILALRQEAGSKNGPEE